MCMRGKDLQLGFRTDPYDLPQQVYNLLRPFLLLVQFCQVPSLKYNLTLVCNNSDSTMDGDLERMDC